MNKSTIFEEPHAGKLSSFFDEVLGREETSPQVVKVVVTITVNIGERGTHGARAA